jgi:glyoxylase-like metal-dependent hydrolase (beta-lactamase superfamily II)
MEVRIISIGTLASHPLWGEHPHRAVRTGHATTTLQHTGSRVILIDPGLPEQALLARLAERANVRAEDVTDVFLTTFKPECRRALAAFDRAEWWVHQTEREAYGVPLAQKLKAVVEEGAADENTAALREALENEVVILKRCKAAEDQLAPRVSLFPLPGVTPGCCGLLIEEPRHTIVIAGDAVPTVEHLEQGQVLSTAADVHRAKESLSEVLEIADIIVPGRDNIVLSPTKRPF